MDTFSTSYLVLQSKLFTNRVRTVFRKRSELALCLPDRLSALYLRLALIVCPGQSWTHHNSEKDRQNIVPDGFLVCSGITAGSLSNS